MILNESGYRGLFRWLLAQINRLIYEFFEFIIDSLCCTYINKDTKELSSINQIIKSNLLQKDFSNIPKPVIKKYLSHQFDLLGSGWTKVCHGMKALGLEGFQYQMGVKINSDNNGLWLSDRVNNSNLTSAKKIWKLIDSSYIPIDWQLDFKSGYRWSEKTWYKNIIHSHKKGVDVKVPWELARMQHLPQMALECSVLSEDLKQKQLLQKEFRNQILDFIATNPPRYGANWACPMDVAIRAANWLLAYDIFRSSGVHFDVEFERLFVESITTHGRNIVKNLEWNNGDRTNHYLANISGLVFISSFLSSSSETDAWLAFSIQELINEVGYQFYPDGTNFEGSTAYHRLSAEMVLFSTALLLGLSAERKQKLQEYDYSPLKTGKHNLALKEGALPMYELPNTSVTPHILTPFPTWYFQRVERMVEFIVDISKPNGHIPQIGDNDSGRFFKLKPEYESITVKEAKKTFANLRGYKKLSDDEIYFVEDHLNSSHLISAGYALFKRNDFANRLGGHKEAIKSPDYYVTKAISGNTNVNLQQMNYQKEEPNSYCNHKTENIFQKLITELEHKSDDVFVHEFKNNHFDFQDGLSIKAYPDFGLYLYKSYKFYLAVRCWPGRKPFHAGHMHLDQFTIELIIDGIELVSDPGCYIYTPLPRIRWQYRSAEAHFTPFVSDQSQLESKNDPFSPITPVSAKPTYFGINGFLSRKIKDDSDSYYLVHIKKHKIKIYCSGFKKQQLTPITELPRSIGYGILLT